MKQRRVLKYLLDIESVLGEIDQITERFKNNFETFQADFILQRAIERELEILGEAVNKLSQLHPDIPITDIPKIVSLRNMIIHSYDSVDPAILWGILQKDIPKLRREIAQVKR